MFKSKKKSFYQIEGLSVELPKNSILPDIQKVCKMYDKFLPFLAEIVGNEYIIDIGANVGDSVAAMINHTNAKFVCVEPANEFYHVLEKNVKSWGKSYDDRVHKVNCFISDNANENYEINEINGTATSNVSLMQGETPTYKLDSLVKLFNILPSSIGLIKIDTDGFDAKCLLSCEEVLKESNAFIFWENQIDTEEQYLEFKRLPKYLYSCGYKYFFLFDNYGNYMLECEAEQLDAVYAYLWRIHEGISYRTMYYCDILACKKKDERDAICNCIQQFTNSFK